MVSVSILAVFLVLYVTSNAATFRRNHVIHEKRELHLEEWERRSAADASEVLPIRIALRERNIEFSHQYIMDVSSPTSANYGKHWDAEKVANTFAPSKETYDKVIQWLQEFGIARDRITHSTGRNWLQFEGTIAEAEGLLDAKYHIFEHMPSGDHHLACDSYSIPEDLSEHIDFIMPTIHIGSLQNLNRRNAPNSLVGAAPFQLNQGGDPYVGLTGLSNCSQLITIECLRAIYQFPAGSTNQTGNQLGVVEFDNYLYGPDLDVFFSRLTTPTIPNGTFPEFISIDGGKRANSSTSALEGGFYVLESSIDFQIAYSIIYPQGARLYQVGDGINVNSVGTFNIFLDALDASYCTYQGGDSSTEDPQYPDPQPGGYKGPLQCGGAPVSNVISVSYAQEEANLSPAYQQRQCREWMKLGLQGVSVLFASGDSGVANRYNAGFPNLCLEANSTAKSATGPRFSPSFPENCPYITVVGGTDLNTDSIFGGERAVSVPNNTNPLYSFYSGGGFSNVFEMPDYQSDAVTNYLTKYPPPYTSQQYNNSGNSRAYPDVSALSWKIALVYDNYTVYSGGTSASTPIVASIVTILNELRLAAGKGPIGFLNPTFYAHPEVFNDVTVGNNPGCGTDGFAAQPGWDPVTGLGTPNFPKLRDLFLGSPIPTTPSSTASSATASATGNAGVASFALNKRSLAWVLLVGVLFPVFSW